MRDWLLHMTEPQRKLAVGIIDAVLVAIGTQSKVPVTRWPNRCSLTLRDLAGRRSGAGVTLSHGVVWLRLPLSPRRCGFAAELSGPAVPPIAGIVDGDVAIIVVTLVEWRSALSSRVTEGVIADAAETERAAIHLLRGVVDAHRSEWESAMLQSSREEGHVARIYSREPDGRQLGWRFASRPARTDGGMTRELVEGIERILADRLHAHVVESGAAGKFRLRFDATPVYAIAGGTDAMSRLRALADLPPGARLVPMRRSGR